MKKAVLITIIAAIGMILVGGAMAFVSLAASGFNITNMMNTVEYEEKTVILSEDFSNMRVEMGNHDIEFLKKIKNKDKIEFVATSCCKANC